MSRKWSPRREAEAKLARLNLAIEALSCAVQCSYRARISANGTDAQAECERVHMKLVKVVMATAGHADRLRAIIGRKATP